MYMLIVAGKRRFQLDKYIKCIETVAGRTKMEMQKKLDSLN